MKYLKNFNENKQDDVKSLCQKYDIKNYTINEDGSIDVDGNVNLGGQGLTKLLLKFRNVGGDFYCSNNQLVSLEGAPQSVGGGFYCFNNQLVSLEGAPQSVGEFYCGDNQLKTLEGAPQSVGGDFYCFNNQLVNLEGAPKSIGGNFNCRNNQLVNLEGAPSCRNIYCSNNPISKWWSQVRDITKLDAFIDLGIDTRDPDFMNQEKIDLLLEQ